MGVPGRSLLEEFTVEEVCNLFIEEYGRVLTVAHKMRCTPRAVYDLLDIHPEIVEAREKGQRRKMDYKIESSATVLQKLVDMVDTNPDLAAKQAQFILKNAKKSPFYTAPASKESDSDNLPVAAIAAMAKKMQDQEKTIKELEAKLGN